ncbi:hypothetical protein Sya03_18410 [Spirilliplanes yamanashiensis]|uniref:Uncharacterized protein n=1 Tax=Spirilliplanes yamanashiensis TaxID=42233 RepID=A0A8J4DIL5_9ACTN|nr:hypothetical protein Sya03_18410 [Spirilliplanes yamanashiensis]
MRRAALAAAAVLCVLLPAAPAGAAPGDIPGTPTEYYSAGSADTQPIHPSAGGWSVVANDDTPMRLRRALPVFVPPRPLFPVLTEAVPGTGWVAAYHGPGGRAPGERLRVESYRQGPVGHYTVQFIDGGTEVLPDSAFTVGVEKARWLADLRHVRLTRGRRVTVTVTGGAAESVSVLRFDPARPTSAVQNWNDALHNEYIGKAEPDHVTTFSFTADVDGVYGLLFRRLGYYADTAEVTLSTS